MQHGKVFKSDQNSTRPLYHILAVSHGLLIRAVLGRLLFPLPSEDEDGEKVGRSAEHSFLCTRALLETGDCGNRSGNFYPWTRATRVFSRLGSMHNGKRYDCE